MLKTINTPLVPMCFASLAGGMGWWIRGQYGHETGAMIAGLLVALVLTRAPLASYSIQSAFFTIKLINIIIISL